MLEKAVFFSEYNNINITGETSKLLRPAGKSAHLIYSLFCKIVWVLQSWKLQVEMHRENTNKTINFDFLRFLCTYSDNFKHYINTSLMHTYLFSSLFCGLTRMFRFFVVDTFL